MSETYVTYRVWDGCKAPINLEYSGRLIGQIVRESTIDHDALLKLADRLDKDADNIISAARDARFTGGGPRMGEAEHDAYEWRYIASRIRDALEAEKVNTCRYYGKCADSCDGHGLRVSFGNDIYDCEDFEPMPDVKALKGLADEMDVHWVGYEGMEASPVACWSRRIHESLGE